MIFASVGYFGLTLGHGSAQTNGYVMVCSPEYDFTKGMPLTKLPDHLHLHIPLVLCNHMGSHQ